MSPRLPGEEVDQRTVDQPGNHRGTDHEPGAEPREEWVGSVSGRGVVLVAGEELGEGGDQPPERHCAETGPGADTEGEHE